MESIASLYNYTIKLKLTLKIKHVHVKKYEVNKHGNLAR